VLDESCPIDARPHLRDAYSYSKIAQERVAWEARERDGLPLVVIRPGVIYGPGRGSLSARVGLQIGGLMIRMGGAQRVPYTFVDNCADAIVSAVTAPDIEGEAFNVVDDELPQAKAVLKQYRRRVKRLRVLPVPGWAISPVSGLCEWYHERSRGQLPRVLTRYKSAAQWKPLRYGNDKAKLRLGWSPRVSIAEGLEQSCAWSRQQLAGRGSGAAIEA
jgi:nucleoside-diphosphate-sugar epimerase